MEKWPLQRDCDKFYGDPRSASGVSASHSWELQNLVYFTPPFQMTYEGRPIKRFSVHIKCHNAFNAVFNNMLKASNNDYEKLKYWGVTKFAGCYNYRLMRGGSSLSMHSYGIAIDLDPENNSFGDRTPRFAQFPEVLKAFADEGAVWGGDWNGNKDTLDERRCDGMHWQFARLF